MLCPDKHLNTFPSLYFLNCLHQKKIIFRGTHLYHNEGKLSGHTPSFTRVKSGWHVPSFTTARSGKSPQPAHHSPIPQSCEREPDQLSWVARQSEAGWAYPTLAVERLGQCALSLDVVRLGDCAPSFTTMRQSWVGDCSQSLAIVRQV